MPWKSSKMSEKERVRKKNDMRRNFTTDLCTNTYSFKQFTLASDFRDAPEISAGLVNGIDSYSVD